MALDCFHELLGARLSEVESRGRFRRIPRLSADSIDFSSNDYLGLSRNLNYREGLAEMLSDRPALSGATGARLISGDSSIAHQLEETVARFHRAECATLFNSGYDANIGLISALARKGDTVVYDKLVHASLRDGIRLSAASHFGFLHNDLDDLRAKLSRINSPGAKFVVVESVYSMDGDLCPLQEISEICQGHDAILIVDEAHATGVFGERGEGRVIEEELQSQIPIRIHTFGKALFSQGAAVVGPTNLRDYLLNFCRPLIFTTFLSPLQLYSTLFAYEWVKNSLSDRVALFRLITRFQQLASEFEYRCSQNSSPIQFFLIPGNQEVLAFSRALHQMGFRVQAIRAPTVKVGQERIRICLHADNTERELERLFECARNIYRGTLHAE
ncbi:MAG: 8-amino-7-oxononanoate synthase [Bdellovibrionales bacterium]|nr:8-amino-7-oxononanoate synthase [Bdellovibrionales bacterium]